MREEELKKEAYLFAKNSKDVQNFECGFDIAFKSYLAGAEPREKQIVELEATNKKISDECHKLVDSLEKKQNENVDLIGKIAFLENDLNNAKARIEQMKNWCNCKNYQQCLIELAEQGKGMNPSECCVNCKKWEIKENEKIL